MSIRGQELSSALHWREIPVLAQHEILHHALRAARHATHFKNMALAFRDNRDYFIENGPAGNAEPPEWAGLLFRRRQVHTLTGQNVLVPEHRADLLLFHGEEDNAYYIATWKLQWSDNRWQCAEQLAVVHLQIPYHVQSCDVAVAANG